jgi:excisionase family DNA binding protein
MSAEASLTLVLTADAVEAIVERTAHLVLARLQADQPSTTSPYLSVAEAADFARCSKQRIYDLRSSGRLTRAGDGARGLVRRDELMAYLEGGHRCP